MPTRRVLRSVVGNFLGTYTSRYSDYGGYWLFGFLTSELGDVDFDLLGDVGETRGMLESAHALAVREFKDQLAKSGLDACHVVDARLHVEQLSLASCAGRDGWNYRFRAAVTADNGRTFASETVIFVAPHDRSLELRSQGAGPWLFRRRRVRGRLDE